MESVNVFQEFNSMHSKIHSLFQDLLNEKNQYQIQLEGMNKYIEKLCNEVKDVKKENNILSNGFRELKHIYLETLKIFKNLDFSSANVIREQNLKLAKLHNSFQNLNEEIENLHPNIPIINVRSLLDGDLIKKEIGSINKLNFSTQVINDDELIEIVSSTAEPIQTADIIECFEKTSPDNNTEAENVESEVVEERVSVATQVVDDGDDKIIVESPEPAVLILDDVENNKEIKTETVNNEIQYSTPSATSGELIEKEIDGDSTNETERRIPRPSSPCFLSSGMTLKLRSRMRRASRISGRKCSFQEQFTISLGPRKRLRTHKLGYST